MRVLPCSLLSICTEVIEDPIFVEVMAIHKLDNPWSFINLRFDSLALLLRLLGTRSSLRINVEHLLYGSFGKCLAHWLLRRLELREHCRLVKLRRCVGLRRGLLEMLLL